MGSVTALDHIRRICGVPVDAQSPIIARRAGRAELCLLFAAMGFKEGAEVGVWTGKFSERICQTVQGVHLRCVDPWTPYAAYRERKNDPERLASAYKEAQQRLRPFGCTLMRMTSLEAAKQVPDASLDFVYLDGNHERAFIQADLQAWTPKVRQGGIVAGHDFHAPRDKPFIQVEPVVREWTAAHRIAPWFVLSSETTPSYFWVKTVNA